MEDACAFVLETVQGVYGDMSIEELSRRSRFPVAVLLPSAEFRVHHPSELGNVINITRKGLREAGVVKVQSSIQTVFYPEDGMSIVATRNTRLRADGTDLGAHISSYIVRYNNGWRFSAVSINNEADDDLRQRIEQLLEAEGVLDRSFAAEGVTR